MFQEDIFDKAGELWNAGSPSNSDLYSRGVTPIFRGQLADPKMRLIPTRHGTTTLPRVRDAKVKAASLPFRPQTPGDSLRHLRGGL